MQVRVPLLDSKIVGDYFNFDKINKLISVHKERY